MKLVATNDEFQAAYCPGDTIHFRVQREDPIGGVQVLAEEKVIASDYGVIDSMRVYSAEEFEDLKKVYVFAVGERA